MPRPAPLATAKVPWVASPNRPNGICASLPRGKIEKPTQIQEDDLWQKAFEEMDEAARKQIRNDFDQSGDISAVGNLIQIVQDHTTRFNDSPTKIIAGERTIIWRDCAARVIDWLTILGDIAVNFAPSPSSIIWSALKVLLKVRTKPRL